MLHESVELSDLLKTFQQMFGLESFKNIVLITSAVSV